MTSAARREARPTCGVWVGGDRERAEAVRAQKALLRQKAERGSSRAFLRAAAPTDEASAPSVLPLFAKVASHTHVAQEETASFDSACSCCLSKLFLAL